MTGEAMAEVETTTRVVGAAAGIWKPLAHASSSIKTKDLIGMEVCCVPHTPHTHLF